MNKFLIKKDLSNIIYKKLNKIISKPKIKKSIDIIINSLADELIEKKSISIKNFGTFSPYLFKGHKSFNVNTGNFIYIDSFLNIKFRTHYSFNKIILLKKKKF